MIIKFLMPYFDWKLLSEIEHWKHLNGLLTCCWLLQEVQFRKTGTMYNNAFLGKPMDVVLYISPYCLQRLLNRTENKNNTIRTTTLEKSFDNMYLFTWHHHKMSHQFETHQHEFTLAVVSEREFSLHKFCNHIMLTWNEHSNFATVSCKRKTSTHFCVKLVRRWTGTGSAHVVFVNSG